ARTIIAGSLLAALVVLPLSVGLQGLDTLARPLGDLLRAEAWSAGYATSYGTGASIAFLTLLAALGSLFLPGRRAAAGAAVPALGLLGASFLASGHVTTAEPQLVSRTALFVHIAGIVLWLGAFLPLLFLLRGDNTGATSALERFSRLIILPL